MGGNFPAGKREGRDGREGPPYFWYPGDIPGEGPKATGNPSGRQGPAKILKIEILLKIEVY